MSQIEEALARTALLVQRDVFPTLPTTMIAGHLAAQRIRLVADDRNLSDPAGQAAAVAFTLAVAQSGAKVHLDLPDVPLAGPQPPLRAGGTLATALFELCARLVCPAEQGSSPAELIVALGNTPVPEQTRVLRLYGDAFAGEVSAAAKPAPPWQGSLCFGAHLAALAGAAECFREAMFTLAARSGTAALPEHRIAAAGNARLALPALRLPAVVELGELDFVSAGAMTNAALSPLLRIEGIRGRLRVMDADVIEISNLNRYALVDASMIGMRKVDALAGYARDGLSIEPLAIRLSGDQPSGPLAPRVMIGVDDIPSRWVAQSRTDGWVCVGATSLTEMVISEHTGNTPCAGCMHPYDDQAPGEIPTVAFVSQLAGVLQAYRLLSNVTGEAPMAPTLAHGLALDSPRALLTIGQAPHPHCPVGCAASRLATR